MTTENVMPLRVLIFHIRISMGHERAAQALAAAFRCRGYSDIRLVEAIGHSSGWLAPVVCRSYMSVVKYVPALWDFLYDDPRATAAAERLLRYWTRRSRANFLRLMADVRPHLVICTQALPARILAKLKERGDGREAGMEAPVFAVVTDFSIHRYWAAPEIDGYFLPGASERQKLVSMGVPSEKISCTGIPIPPEMADPVSESDLERARRLFGLHPGRPTLLLMGGSRGVGLKSDLMKELEHLPYPVNILAPAGTNLAALEELCRWSASSRHRVVPLEYRTDIRELYALSDVAITKPGGLTLAECMAVGLPMVIQHAMPGQEQHNLEFVRSSNLAEIGTDASDVAARVNALLMNPARLQHLRLRLKSSARPDAAFAIVDQLLRRFPVLPARSGTASAAAAARPQTLCPSLGH